MLLLMNRVRWPGFNGWAAMKDLPEDCADIATFTRRDPVLKGVGRALFAETVKPSPGALGFVRSTRPYGPTTGRG